MWIVLIIAVLALCLFLLRRQYSKWERAGIPHEKPSIPAGSLGPVIRKERSLGLQIFDIYQRHRDKFVGVYFLYRPAILIRDAQLARKVLTTDFASFHDRGINSGHSDIFSLRGQEWKALRAKLTPSFTTGKLRGMFGTVNDVADKMIAHLNGLLENKDSVTLDVKKIFTTLADLLVHFGYRQPALVRVHEMVQRTIEFREKHNVVRRDLLQLLIQLRNTGKISEDDKNWNIETPAAGLKAMPIEMLAAQAFIFFIAGTETTSATTAFTIYELAMYPDLLQRAQKEIKDCLAQHHLTSNELTYEALQDMKFLELCVMETTRKYPGLPFLNRECTQNYTIPDTDFTIEKGTPIIISLFGLHRDPQYFPDPLKYDPERFTAEKNNYDSVAYMPFGEGPRHCIAQRMGVLNSKIAIVKLLSNFDIEPIARKEVEFVFDAAPVLVPKDGLNVRLTRKK